MNILTIIVIAIMVVLGFTGMRKGFIKTVFSMFSLIVTLILTAILSPVVSQRLVENEQIVSFFSEKVSSVLGLENLEDKVNDDIRENQQKLFDALPLPDSIKDALQENNNTNYYETLGVKSFDDYISFSVACMIIRAVSFVLTFLVISVLLWLLCTSLDLISKLPVLNSANHLLGLAAGVVNALIIVWVFFVIVTAISSTAFGSDMMRMISESPFLNYIYSHNILLGKITQFIS